MKTQTVISIITLCLVAQVSYGTPRNAMRKKVVRANEISSMFQDARAQRRPMAQGAVARYIKRIQLERDPSLYKMGVFSLLKTKMPLMKDQNLQLKVNS